ncbi:hypothetical protein QBC46DRAFT_8461 [Diplogelasinospora grovesii]|uniref:Secreted protein n=1 Tax=Diplogelasinospora grovesii TaxID=303347 RepID=A0AAN6S8Y6_9PEZI|nr:hypothetical protein QBC46DRAFT_8461 [Diplogelasinospora grovesii]
MLNTTLFVSLQLWSIVWEPGKAARSRVHTSIGQNKNVLGPAGPGHRTLRLGFLFVKSSELLITDSVAQTWPICPTCRSSTRNLMSGQQEDFGIGTRIGTDAHARHSMVLYCFCPHHFSPSTSALQTSSQPGSADKGLTNELNAGDLSFSQCAQRSNDKPMSQMPGRVDDALLPALPASRVAVHRRAASHCMHCTSWAPSPTARVSGKQINL